MSRTDKDIYRKRMEIELHLKTELNDSVSEFVKTLYANDSFKVNPIAVLEGEVTYRTLLALLNKFVYFDYVSDDIKELCCVVIESIGKNTFEKNEVKKRRLYHACDMLLSIRTYKFVIMCGGTYDIKTFYAVSYVAVWDKVSNYIRCRLEGVARAVFCVQIDGEDIGTLSNLEELFTPRVDGQVNGMKADQVSIKWKDYK